MILREITEVLEACGRMSLAELARHFKSEISAMEGMLNTLERKGRIRRIEIECAKCKGCVSMNPEAAVFFEAV